MPVIASKAALRRNLVELRRASEVNQEALARAMQAMGLAHWRQTTVSRVERGAQDLTAEELIALGFIFGQPLFEDTMLEWSDESPFMPDVGDQDAIVAARLKLAQAQALAESRRARLKEAEIEQSAASARVSQMQAELNRIESQLLDIRSEIAHLTGDPNDEVSLF